MRKSASLCPIHLITKSTYDPLTYKAYVRRLVFETRQGVARKMLIPTASII